MRPHLVSISLVLPSLVACGSGDWTVTTWGEEFIEEGIPATEFGDGCSAVYDRFEVEITSATLLHADEEVVGEVPSGRFELTDPGPQELGSVSVPAGDYERVYYAIGPGDSDAVRASGTVTCGDDTVSFDWSFSPSPRYRCLPLEVTVPEDGEVTTELTIHGDHLFFDSLEDEGGTPQGQAIVDADGDGNAEVTLEELEAVAVADLGYPLGIHTDVTELGEFITLLVQGVGHVDGEGHCYVDG